MTKFQPPLSVDELHLSASNSAELIPVLTSATERLPHLMRGVGTKRAESYLMSNVLATIALSPYIRYPLLLTHGDRPDFLLTLDGEVVGVECVTSVPQDWLEIEALRQRGESSLPISIPRFTKSSKSLSLSERRKIAHGDGPAYPIMGNATEVDWANGVADCVANKTTKLQDGFYGGNRENWLLIHDLWPGAIHFESDLHEAAGLALPLLRFEQPRNAFQVIFVKSRDWLVTFTPGGFQVGPIHKILTSDS